MRAENYDLFSFISTKMELKSPTNAFPENLQNHTNDRIVKAAWPNQREVKLSVALHLFYKILVLKQFTKFKGK